MIIRFLRDFKASRMIKGKFKLHLPDGRGKQHYAFSSCETEFNSGQRVGVKTLRNDSTLVVIDEPAIGEVVLDNAEPGVDYEVIRAAG